MLDKITNSHGIGKDNFETTFAYTLEYNLNNSIVYDILQQ